MKKTIYLSVLFLFAVIAAGIFINNSFPKEIINTPREDNSSPVRAVKEEISGSPVVLPDIYPELPVNLKIPKLAVNADVEYVGKDGSGRMDVPKKDEDVAWWKFGAKPGEMGSAVLAGHFDRKDGGPAVFYDLSKLKMGDTIEVMGEKGEILSFEVVGTEIFKDSEFPLQEVFGRTDGRYLNLITCDGVYDRNSKNYSDRLVVFTELVE